MRIYLLGYMGSGKTTVGKKLASKLQFTFLDLDRSIENTYKTTKLKLFLLRYNSIYAKPCVEGYYHQTYVY